MKGFIYKITNKLNNKSYIGQTIQEAKERFYQHCASKCEEATLRMAIHRAILKYGKENFTLEVIEEVEQELLNEREKYWIQYYNTYVDGYNETLGGQDGSKPFKNLDSQEIIRKYEQGLSLRKLGKLFNVDKRTIKDLLVRNKVTLKSTRTYKFTQEQRQELMNDYLSGTPRKQLIDKWKISKGYLSQLINGYRRI